MGSRRHVGEVENGRVEGQGEDGISMDGDNKGCIEGRVWMV